MALDDTKPKKTNRKIEKKKRLQDEHDDVTSSTNADVAKGESQSAHDKPNVPYVELIAMVGTLISTVPARQIVPLSVYIFFQCGIVSSLPIPSDHKLGLPRFQSLNYLKLWL